MPSTFYTWKADVEEYFKKVFGNGWNEFVGDYSWNTIYQEDPETTPFEAVEHFIEDQYGYYGNEDTASELQLRFYRYIALHAPQKLNYNIAKDLIVDAMYEDGGAGVTKTAPGQYEIDDNHENYMLVHLAREVAENVRINKSGDDVLRVSRSPFRTATYYEDNIPMDLWQITDEPWMKEWDTDIGKAVKRFYERRSEKYGTSWYE
jgi:hypothetical protein